MFACLTRGERRNAPSKIKVSKRQANCATAKLIPSLLCLFKLAFFAAKKAKFRLEFEWRKSESRLSD